MPDPAPESPAPAVNPAANADGAGDAPKPPKPKTNLKQLFKEGIAGYKKIWPYIDKYRWRFIASIIAGAGSAVFTLGQAQALRMIAHMNFDKNPEAAGGSVSIKGFVMDVTLHGAPPHLPSLWHVFLVCSFFPLVIVARCVCDYLEGYYMTWVSLRVLHDLRVKIFEHILSQSFDFFNKAKIGSLISRVSNDTRSAQLSITAVTDDIITQPLTVICLTIGMFRMDWRFTMYCLCVFPLCLIPMQIFGKRVRKIGLQDETANAELMVLLHECLTGIRLVKSLSREPYEGKRFAASSKAMIAVGLKVRKAMMIVPPLIESMGGVGIYAAFVYAYFSHMQVSIFVTMVGMVALLYIPVKKLSKVHVSVQKALGATTKIFELLDVNPTIKDAPDAVTLKNCRGEIQYEDITFEYTARLQPALRRVSLHIEPGKSYALVGASGAGKSTMFSLLLRFYDPRRGCVRVDGHDIRTLTQKSLRQNVGMVSQDTFLFNASIMENIRYGRLDATDDEVKEAARQAYAHDFIEAQQFGYETVIGDQGCNLSGGQKQRLSIARAILKNSPILLLDEATSALDSESEKEIQAALEILSRGKTVIAIAHRLSTILKSDNIVVMEAGYIRDVGPHAELLTKSPLYRHFYNLQFNEHKNSDAPLEAAGQLA